MQVMNEDDYYTILEVARGADATAIRKAYRRLARQYHPDLNPGDPGAEQKFKEINEAYQVLADVERRRLYDRFGRQWTEHVGGPRVQPAEEINTGGSSTGADVRPADPYAGGGNARVEDEKWPGGDDSAQWCGGRDIHVSVRVTLEEAYRGTVRTFHEGVDQISVAIPSGVQTGSRIWVRHAGGPGCDALPPGDLYLNIVVLPHTRFTRVGDDLRVAVTVDAHTALMGGEVVVAALDRAVCLRLPPNTLGGEIFCLQGLGMPHLWNPARRGDLYVQVNV